MGITNAEIIFLTITCNLLFIHLQDKGKHILV